MKRNLLVRFLLICEGTSDAALRRPLEDLCVQLGADEVEGIAPDLGRLPNPPGNKIGPKVKCALDLEPGVNLIFIHRDADSASPKRRCLEIDQALASLSENPRYVPVVPVRMTEAWLLSDRKAISAITGRDCNVYKPGQVESISDPKRRLQHLLQESSGASGRRLEKFKKRFPAHRRRLIENLDISGPVARVDSWKRLVENLREALKGMTNDHSMSASAGDGAKRPT